MITRNSGNPQQFLQEGEEFPYQYDVLAAIRWLGNRYQLNKPVRRIVSEKKQRESRCSCCDGTCCDQRESVGLQLLESEQQSGRRVLQSARAALVIGK